MADPIHLIAQWLRTLLSGWGLHPLLVNIIVDAIGIVVLCVFVLVVAIFLVWVERKVVARFQDRLGPNRVGPFGLIQPIADVLKLLIKEELTPEGADKVVFNIPPILALATVLLLWAVVPLTPQVVGADINIGVLYIVAIGAISTLGIIMAGWASNNKYALISAFRTVAQMVSYEVPMVISLLVPVILARSMGMTDIIQQQTPFYNWYLFMAPVAAVIFLLTSIAELGRAPFDLIEAESEIVAGFHIEYSGMKFGMFYAGELLHTLTVGAIFSILFLGGWNGPWVNDVPILGVFYLFIKSFFIYYVIMWIKYTMPRIRIDHMLDFNWKFLTPLSIALMIVVAIVFKALEALPGWAPGLGWETTPPWIIWLGILLSNILVGWIAISLARRYVHIERQRVGTELPVARPDAQISVSID